MPSAANTSLLKFAKPLLAALALALSSCSSIDDEVKSAVSANKLGSLQMWERETGQAGAELLQSTALNTGLLLSGWKSVDARAATTGENQVTIDYQMKSSSDCSIGSAVPITRDGYFLTARHCVSDKPLPHQIVVICGSGANFHAETAPYRVVWQAEDELLDLALIHVPVRPARIFPLGRWSNINAGDLVAVTGWSGSKEISQGAGKILHVQNVPTTIERGDWNEIYHDAPLVKGDSGGLLLNPQGQLLGINSKFIINPLKFMLPGKWKTAEGYRGVSIVPDAEVIRKHLVRDRAENRLGIQ